MSNSSNSSGSFARDETHNSIKDSYYEADMRLIADSLNNLIKNICHLNFANIKDSLIKLKDHKKYNMKFKEILKQNYRIYLENERY